MSSDHLTPGETNQHDAGALTRGNDRQTVDLFQDGRQETQTARSVSKQSAVNLNMNEAISPPSTPLCK